MWLFVVWGLLQPGCSVLLDTKTSQCDSDGDCARFGRAVCDLGKRVCVASTAPVDAGVADAAVAEDAVSCQGPGGCFQCSATTDQELLSACTGATCIPFDNRRLTRLNPDGTLTPLP